MNKINYLTFSGIAMAIAGALMLTSESIGIGTAKFLVPLMFAIGGVLAYMFANANKQHKLANQYHAAQGIGMIIFAVIIGLGAENLGDFLKYITYFMLFFGLIEIIFAFMALNSSQKLNTGILISRFIAGLFNLIGAVVILATSVTDEINGLLIAGILVIIGGIAFIVFSFRIRKITSAS